MPVLYMLRCSLCDRTTPAFIDEQAMWCHVWDEGWTTVATLPEHHCPDCAKEQP